MKHYRIPVLVGFFCTVAIIVSVTVITKNLKAPALKDAEADYQIAKYEIKRRNLERTENLIFWGSVGVLTAACLAGLILAAGWHRAHVKQAKVHVYKIDNSEIVVHERDLSMAWQICTGLVNAQALERSNQGLHKAFELYHTMAEIHNAQLRALLGRRGIRPALPAPQSAADLVVDSSHPPSFATLLQHGTIAPDKPLVFGFANGIAKTGTWQDIFSNATGGQSGSGKTNTLRSLIAQSIIQGVSFWIVDYHWPHKESLLATLGALRDTPYITYADAPIDVRPLLEEVDETIDRRLNTTEPCTAVKVLAVDEVLRIIKNCPYTEEVIERIGTEGRKVNVFGLFSAQSWNSEKVSTTARDNLTSIFAHNMKRQQARTLLQDTDQAKIVQKLKKGQMLFCPVNDQEGVLDVPYCSESDVKMVANMVGYAVTDIGNVTGNAGNVTDVGNDPETPEVTGQHSPVTRLRFLAETADFSLSQTARDIGINKGYLSNILKGKRPSPDALHKITTWLRTHDTTAEIIPFPKTH